MIAQQNDYLQEASKAYYRLTQEERIRQICEAREDYYRCQRGMQRKRSCGKKDNVQAFQ